MSEDIKALKKKFIRPWYVALWAFITLDNTSDVTVDNTPVTGKKHPWLRSLPKAFAVFVTGQKDQETRERRVSGWGYDAE